MAPIRSRAPSAEGRIPAALGRHPSGLAIRLHVRGTRKVGPHLTPRRATDTDASRAARSSALAMRVAVASLRAEPPPRALRVTRSKDANVGRAAGRLTTLIAQGLRVL